MAREGMVQVSGRTYRIEKIAQCHEVVRIADDRRVGAFTHGPGLRIVRSEIDSDELTAIARAALRAARLPWAGRRASAQADGRTLAKAAGRAWSVGALRAIANLLLALWPLVALCP